MKTSTRFLHITGLLLILGSIIVYYIFVFHFSVNIPYSDDYRALTFIDTATKTSFLARIPMFFSQAFEHRIFSYFVAIYTQYKVLGEVNFRLILLFGNIGMVGLLYMLYRLKGTDAINPALFAPAALLLMMPQHQVSDWGVETMNAINEYLLVFVSLFLLTKTGKGLFAVAMALAFIAMFSFGNGMFVFPAGFVVLLLQPKISAAKVTTWAVFMAGCLFFFFFDYKPAVNPYPKTLILHQPIQGALVFLTFLGSIYKLPYAYNFLYPLCGGIAFVVLCCLVVFRWKFFRENPLFPGYLVFILLTGMALTISRVAGGIDSAAALRYRLSPAIFLALLYLALVKINKTTSPKLLLFLLAGSLCLYVVRLRQNYHDMALHRYELEAGLCLYNAGQDNPYIPSYFSQEAAYKILNNSIDRGYYKAPTGKSLDLASDLQHDIQSVPESNNIEFYFDKFADNQKVAYISGWAFIRDNYISTPTISLVLKSPEKTFILGTTSIRRDGVREVFRKTFPGVTENCGFSCIIVKKDGQIPPQKYQLGIAISVNRTMRALQLTNQFIVIEHDTLLVSSNHEKTR